MVGYGRHATRSCDTPDERPRRDWDQHRDYPGADDPRSQRNLWPDDNDGTRNSRTLPSKFQTATQSKHARRAFARLAQDNYVEPAPYVAPASTITADALCAIATIAVAAGMIQPNQALGVTRTLLRAYRASLSFQSTPDDTPSDMAFRPITLSRDALRLAAIKLDVALAGNDDLAATLAGRVLAAVVKATG